MARYDFTTQRLFVAADLSANAVIEMDRAHANYLLNVLRMKDGDKVLLFNGRDGEWLCEVSPKGRKSCHLHALSQTRTQPAPYTLHYIFAPLKKSRLDYMVQKAVEMGAGVLQPVITAHTQNSKLNIERLRANVVEASEQCGILNIPALNEPMKLDSLLENWDENCPLVYGDEHEEQSNSLDTLNALKGKNLALLVGPEGGFSPQERDQLRAKSCVYPISLGPRILRADTAAVAAMAVIQAIAGDWDCNAN